MRLRIRTIYWKDGLRRAPQIFRKNFRGTLQTIGKRLARSARSRMRKDTGEAQRKLKTQITIGERDMRVEVYSTLIQAFVDAYGLRRGVFPKYGPGSPLYRWAERRVKGKERKRIANKNLGTVPKMSKDQYKEMRSKRSKAQKLTRTSTKRSRRKAKAGTSEVRREAFLIAKSIFNKGIKPTHWNRKALEANRRVIVNDFKGAITRSLRELGRG